MKNIIFIISKYQFPLYQNKGKMKSKIKVTKMFYDAFDFDTDFSVIGLYCPYQRKEAVICILQVTYRMIALLLP